MVGGEWTVHGVAAVASSTLKDVTSSLDTVSAALDTLAATALTVTTTTITFLLSPAGKLLTLGRPKLRPKFRPVLIARILPENARKLDNYSKYLRTIGISA